MDPRFNDEAKAFVELATSLLNPTGGLSKDILRTFLDQLHAKGNQKLFGTFKGTLEEKYVKTNSADIPINIYTPINHNKDILVIFFHGGGWTLGSRETHQTMINLVSEATKTIWISVEYRLGPEYKYPIWLDDACDVTRYIMENKESYGVDRTAKIGVAGDSAGGMISASVSQTLKNVDFQILIYGIFDLNCTAPSYKEFVHPQYFCTPEMLNWVIRHAFDDGVDLNDPRISVIYNSTHDHVPPTLFIVAELDPLRDDSYAYKAILDKAGVKSRLVLLKGVPHAFFALPGIYPKTCEQAIEAIREFMATLD